jgi:hmsD
MVINKGRSLPLLIKAKSFALDLVTWALWGYVITFVARYADRIFTKPIIDSLLFLDIVSIMFTVSAVLVVLAYVWSILTVAKE